MEIRVRTDDVAKQSTDVIFNYTDYKMTNKGTISKRLCAAAGPGLQKECNERLRKRKVFSKGAYLSTDGFQLPCKHVLHVSIPTEHGESDQDFPTWLTGIYINSFLFARTTLKAKTITVPLIESGEVPPNMSNVCATALASALKQFSKRIRLSTSYSTIHVVNMTPTATDTVREVFSNYFQALIGSSGASERDAASRILGLINQPATYSHVLQRDDTKGGLYQRPPSASNTLLSSANACPVCKVPKAKIHSLEGCGHRACVACIEAKITPNSACQECGVLYGWLTEPICGGRMKYYKTDRWQLEGKGTLVLDFDIPSGIQNVSTISTIYLPTIFCENKP
ncbi:protein mono-ADP-ribosyltransferase PARP14-like [Amphiura filiformis]|uniref:protein mono-ADP-ribosyltransferase PARP14-like n=1 Tax=Amphiura filiformis TaxID=82378 RepID=UPI003B21648E